MALFSKRVLIITLLALGLRLLRLLALMPRFGLYGWSLAGLAAVRA
jgi:hypothetical protein